jgi:hypothetical protein
MLRAHQGAKPFPPRSEVALIEERDLDVDVSLMTEEWWPANISGKDSNLRALCRTCGRACTSSIHTLQRSSHTEASG